MKLSRFFAANTLAKQFTFTILFFAIEDHAVTARNHVSASRKPSRSIPAGRMRRPFQTMRAGDPQPAVVSGRIA